MAWAAQDEVPEEGPAHLKDRNQSKLDLRQQPSLVSKMISAI